MTSQPTRRRRRNVPVDGDGMPRPAASKPAVARRPVPGHHREHHVTTDYSYVHKDLILVAGVTSVVVAFIVAMSFVL